MVASVLNVALPAIQTSLGATVGEMQWGRRVTRRRVPAAIA